MSCHIEVIYHPISQAAQLTINHYEFVRPGSRMQKIIIGKPMDEWLEPVTRGYIQWNGLLPELVSETNENVFEIVFEGSSADYNRFFEAVQRQAAALSEIGFDPIDMKLTHRERFSVRQMRDQMLGLRRGWSVSVPTQSLMFQRDRLDARLESDLTTEQIYALIEDYIALIRQMQHNVGVEEQPKLAEMRKAWENLID